MPFPSETVIFETEYWTIYLATDQTYFSRCYVLIKRDCGHLSQLTDAEVLDFHHNVVINLEKAVTKAFGATMFNWSCLMNNDYRVPNPHPKVRWHVRPRFAQPVTLDGIEYTDPNFGHHYITPPDKIVTDTLRLRIASILKEHLHGTV